MVVAAMCCLSCCVYGAATNAAGVFLSAVADEYAVGKGAVSLTLTISSFAMALSGLLVPRLLKEKTLKMVFLISSMFMVASTIGMAVSTSLFLLYFWNGIRGFAAGMLSYVTISIFVNNWFYAKHGLITSITMGFAGISGAVFSPLFTMWITQFGWRTTYIATSFLIALLCLPAIVLPITLRPETSGLQAYGREEKKINSASLEETPSAGMLAFILLCSVAIAGNFVIGLVQHLPSYALSIGAQPEAGALMLSLALIGNIGSKLISGWLADAIGTKNSLLIIAGLLLSAILLLFVTQNKLCLYAGALLIGCGYGIGAVGITLMTKSLFGVEGFLHIYPIVSFLGAISYAVATTIIGYLFDLTGSYQPALEICIILSVIVILCIIFAHPKKKQKNTLANE